MFAVFALLAFSAAATVDPNIQAGCDAATSSYDSELRHTARVVTDRAGVPAVCDLNATAPWMKEAYKWDVTGRLLFQASCGCKYGMADWCCVCTVAKLRVCSNGTSVGKDDAAGGFNLYTWMTGATCCASPLPPAPPPLLPHAVASLKALSMRTTAVMLASVPGDSSHEQNASGPAAAASVGLIGVIALLTALLSSFVPRLRELGRGSMGDMALLSEFADDAPARWWQLRR